MTRRGLLVSGLAVLVLLAAAVIWIRYSEFSSIDACLDSGGAWNQSARECNH